MDVSTAYYIVLANLIIVCCFLRHQKSQGQYGDTHVDYVALRRRYLVAFFMALFADWLQGPYIYRLYSSYGFVSSQIAILYIVGFGASAVVGTTFGIAADQWGRRRTVLICCLTYIVCCLLKLSQNFLVLIIGRMFGGIATSLLFSAFESWYVHEHIEHNRFAVEWMSLTFTAITFWNGCVAIVAGMVASFAAETLAFGPIAPFMIALPFLLMCVIYVATTWSENFGSVDTNRFLVFHSFTDGLWRVFSSQLLLTLGIVQSLFESAMHVFVFVWTPVLDERLNADGERSTPLGLIFACFMVCIMIGSSIQDLAFQRGSIRQEQILIGSLCLGLSSMLFASFAGNSPVTYVIAFFMFEIAVGMYYPTTSYLRSRVVPESHRTAILNWFRLPMNAITCCALFALRGSDVVNVDDAFTFCIVSLAIALIVGLWFTKLMSNWKGGDEAKPLEWECV